MKDLFFNEENHTYTYKGIQVPSVTNILQKTIFFDKYKNVPEAVLEQASLKGSFIHKEIEEYIKNDKVGFTEELENFIPEFEKIVLRDSSVESEFQIGSEDYAGTIDLLFNNKEKQNCIADIKTTSSLDTDYVSWQLSFYSELYEKNNPECKIDKLYAIWLKGEKCKIVEVARKSKEEIENVLKAFKENRAYIVENKLVQHFGEDNLVYLADVLKKIKTFEKFTKDFKKQIEEYMVENNITSYDSKEIRISRGSDAIERVFSPKKLESENEELFKKYNKTIVSFEFDEEQFKKDFPELYSDCLIEKKKKGVFKITVR